jgi:hypothetical protein
LTRHTWVWKDAYKACEAAQLLFLRRHFAGMRTRAGSRARLLDMLARFAALTPTHTRRSEESQQLQQFSTPMELGFIAALPASITPADLVLEPSAGTGQLAVFAELHGASLALNEIAETRADLLSLLFPPVSVTRFNAEQIHDYLPEAVRPTVILMNPPFSAAPNVKGGIAGTDLCHLRSALQRLAPGGRLVAIAGINASPSHPEKVPDHLHRHTLVEQVLGCRVTQRVCPARPGGYADAIEAVANQLSESLAREWPDRRGQREEEATPEPRWANFTYVGDDGLSERPR